MAPIIVPDVVCIEVNTVILNETPKLSFKNAYTQFCRGSLIPLQEFMYNTHTLVTATQQ